MGCEIHYDKICAFSIRRRHGISKFPVLSCRGHTRPCYLLLIQCQVSITHTQTVNFRNHHLSYRSRSYYFGRTHSVSTCEHVFVCFCCRCRCRCRCLWKYNTNICSSVSIFFFLRRFNYSRTIIRFSLFLYIPIAPIIICIYHDM